MWSYIHALLDDVVTVDFLLMFIQVKIIPFAIIAPMNKIFPFQR